MEDPKWDSKFFFQVLYGVLTAALIERAEMEALRDAILEAGVLPPERYVQLREAKRRAVFETIQAAGRSDENPWLALLKAFEGTVQ